MPRHQSETYGTVWKGSFYLSAMTEVEDRNAEVTIDASSPLYVHPSDSTGVYAETDFKEEDLVLKDQMFAGIQHSSNKVDCLVCSCCFCFIGSIELQIGRKLYLEQLGVSPNNECHMQKDRYNSDSSLGEDDSDVEDKHVSKECSSIPSKDKIPLPKDVVESLFNGEMKLPYSEKFSLPPVVTCPGGCKENYYCSKSCAEADWESFHSLLCTGEGSKSLSTKALLKFIEHANDTNDIFLLAAKVISFTVLRHRKLKESRHEGKRKQVISESIDFSLLGEAWKPVSMGYKRRWWDCIALPDDVDGSNEASFRMQIKELAFTSLQLLKAAIFDEECKPLFSLEIYGNIIGMFEMNNLDLVVESPVGITFYTLMIFLSLKRERLSKLQSLSWMLLVMTIQFVVKVPHFPPCKAV